MNIRIYQIDMERDTNNVAFVNYENLEKFQGSHSIDSSIYNKVFEGEVTCQDLEEVFVMFNVNHPTGYTGRSLSVSDVVEIIGEKCTFHFCDSFGFKYVEFEPSIAKEKSKIKVVLLEPGTQARITEIDSSIHGMQSFVGGDIQAVYPFEEEVCIVCDDEGKLKGYALLPMSKSRKHRRQISLYSFEKSGVSVITSISFSLLQILKVLSYLMNSEALLIS